MLRGMVFVDHMNFNIAIKDLYSAAGQMSPSLDYNTVFRGIVSLIPNVDFIKTMVFYPEPDTFLMGDNYLCSYAKWTQGMKNGKYLDTVPGRYVSRPVDSSVPMDINDRTTYYKVEKGTDINLAIHALSKAYNNAYDVAFVCSADTDYISLYTQLRTLGKLVVAVAVKGQTIKKIIPEVDDYLILDDTFFSNHLRKKQQADT